MFKTSQFFVLTILIFLYSCKKEQKPIVDTSGQFQLTIVSGNNQTAAIGDALPDSIIVKVTKGGIPLNNYIVQFTGSGCNSDLSAQISTGADGTAKYSWRMANDLGPQKLTVIAINNNIKVDSLTVLSTAYKPTGTDDLTSACTPYNITALAFCQITSGRIFACFYGKTSLRYSDDDGISWLPLTNFGDNHTITSIISTPKDELFVATGSEGIFYSKDLGLTWADVSPPTFNNQSPVDINYTASGKILVNGHLNSEFISNDNGKTWVGPGNGLTPNFSYYEPVELNNGDLYVLNFGLAMFRSVDGGQNWTGVNNRLTDPVYCIYVDKNGWFYKYVNYQILISKDNGATFSLFAVPTELAVKMEIFQDGGFYYSSFESLRYLGNATMTIPDQLVVANIDATLGFSSDSFHLTPQKHILYIYKGLIRRQLGTR